MACAPVSPCADVHVEVCGACFQKHRDARLLSCLHSFCRECIDQLSVTEENGNIRCPLCRTTCRLPENGAVGLPNDFTAGGNRTTLLSAEPCRMCKNDEPSNKATFWCVKCHTALCSEHALQHLQTPVDGGHSLDALGRATSESLAKRISLPCTVSEAVALCPKHDQSLRFHCGACDSPICGDCAVIGDHRGHEPVHYVKEQRKAKVTMKVEQLQHTSVARLERSLQAVDKVCCELEQRAEEVSANIRQAGKRAVAAVETCTLQLLQEVDDIKEGRLKILHEQHDELKRHLEAAQNALQFSNKLLGREGISGEPFILLLHALEKRVSGLLSTEIMEQPQHHSHFLFHPVEDNTLFAKAKESIGRVFPCQASAKHSTITDQLSKSTHKEKAVRFTLQAKNRNDEVVTVGGDVIHTKWVQTSNTLSSPAVSVEDHKNGTYTISCPPAAVGTYELEILVNGDSIPNHLSITYVDYQWAWDASESHPSVSISENRQKASTVLSGRNSPGFMSVVGNTPMRHGQYTWKIRIGEDLRDHMLGVVTKPLLQSRLTDHNRVAYGWFSAIGCNYRDGVQYDGKCPSFRINETFQLCLDCDHHTLEITNLHSGERSILCNLPDREYYQYGNVHHCGNSVEFVD